MKKQLFSSVVIILFTLCVQAQEFCTTPASSENKDLMLDTYRHLDFSPYSFCVKIYIHVIRMSNGTGGQSVADVEEALGYLDSAFNPFDIYFDWDNSINYIDNTTLYNTPSTIMNIDSYDHEDGVDIYLFDDSYSHPITGNGFGTTSGIGEEPAKLLVAGSRNTGYGTTPLARSHVLSHEMGHVLFLWHTHHGTVLEAGDPDQCSELVDGSNAYLCGDYIFDTPADPNISYNVDEECEWQGSGVDANNDPYTPDELNIMSYTHPLCMEYFTSRQAARMKTALGMLPHLKLLSKYNYQLDPCATFQSGLNFYPNPAAEILHLDLREKPIGLYTYYLYNNYNVLVLSGQSQNILQTLDTSSLEEGVYYLHFYDINELIIKQIIINH